MAFLASNKLHIELQRKQGKWQGILLSKFIKDPTRFLASILLGNTISLVVYGYYMTLFLHKELAVHFPFRPGICSGHANCRKPCVYLHRPRAG